MMKTQMATHRESGAQVRQGLDPVADMATIEANIVNRIEMHHPPVGHDQLVRHVENHYRLLLKEASITTYIPMLTEKIVREHLRKRAN